MSDNSSNNKRIAKNTLILYLRMLFTMFLSLYISRATLSILGQTDFGIYNIVGGVVVLFSFLTNAMTSSTQRYLNYYLGLNDKAKLLEIFNSAIFAHITILLIILLLAETLGLWFFETKLNIPYDRMNAARWVYQMSVMATCLGVIVIPYRSAIIAIENMKFFAFVSILDVFLKFLIVLLLPFIKFDKLIFYSIMFSLITVVDLVLYIIVCRNRLEFTDFRFIWNKNRYKELLSFSSWYLLGGVCMVGTKQGVNILLNIFKGVTLNAAVGVANQVRGAIFTFVTNFQTAFNPQIVKLYASNSHAEMFLLISRASRFSFYLLFVLSFPVILYCKEILSLWLVEVPLFAVVFTQLVIVSSFFEALSAPLWTAIGATGHIKRYQLYVSLIISIEIPIDFFLLKYGISPEYIFGVNVIMNLMAYLFRLIYISRHIKMSIISYLSDVVLKCCFVVIFSTPLPILLKGDNTLFETIMLIVMTLTLSMLSILFLGINADERKFIISNIRSFIIRKV